MWSEQRDDQDDSECQHDERVADGVRGGRPQEWFTLDAVDVAFGVFDVGRPRQIVAPKWLDLVIPAHFCHW